LVPSTNFILEQSYELGAGWSPVTNPPTLNMTNLREEVELGVSSGGRFYRLRTQ
jgi:hypothetical protein